MGTKRFIPCGSSGLSTGIDIVTVDPRDIGDYREDKDHCQDNYLIVISIIRTRFVDP